MTNREVAKRFSDGRSGHSQNMFIDGNTIYSYGYHYPIAKRIGGVFIFNPRYYSSTTAQHKSNVWNALHGERILNVPGCSSDPKIVLSYLNDLKKNFIEKIKRARERKIQWINEFKHFLEDIPTYNRVFGLSFYASLDELDIKTRMQIL